MEPLEVVLRKIEELRRDLYAEIVVQEFEGHEEETSGSTRGTPGCHSYTDVDPESWSQPGESKWVVDKERIVEPDTEKQKIARAELESIVNSSDKLQIIKYAAARALRQNPESCFGYYHLRFWVHRHPVAATVTGIATFGAASGLVYALVEYFSK